MHLQEIFCRGEGMGGSEHPASCTLHSRFPPPSIAAPASAYFSYCKICANVAKFSHFSWLPPLLDIPSPAPSSPASRRPPAPITARFPPHCPGPPSVYPWYHNFTLKFNKWVITFAKPSFVMTFIKFISLMGLMIFNPFMYV